MWLVYAAAAAVCFGFRGILYQWTSRRPIDRNLLLLGVYLCGALISFVINLFLGQAWTAGALLGLLMGLFSFTSNAAMYKGFAVGKTSLIAMLIGMPPIVVVALSYLLWGEKLSGGQWAAFGVIFTGLVLLRWSGDFTLSRLNGIQWGILAMFTFAFTDVSSKQATLLNGNTFPTLALMYTTGSLLFLLLWLKGRKRTTGPAAQPDPDSPEAVWPPGKTFFWGMTVGLTNIAGMILILPAFRLGITGLVSAVIAMNVLMILLYARVFLKEKLSRLELTGVLCTFAGVLCLRLLG
ncbi:DMT family transporter [Paenibacillus sp. CC-CFT747]|nr:DMT family transporter [Paenibacillus sp. CC-CFT747]